MIFNCSMFEFRNIKSKTAFLLLNSSKYISRKILCCIFALFFSFSTLRVQAQAIEFEPPFDIKAQVVYIVDRSTGNVVYSKNPEEKISPASLAKMMTAILAVENLDLNKELEFKFYLQDILYQYYLDGAPLSQAGLLSGEKITVQKLLYGLMLPSGADAALALADEVGDGSLDYFTELMNKKAKELGAVNTNFTNPHGNYDVNQYTTAKDLYLIADYLMNNEILNKISSTTFFDGGPTNKHETLNWSNTNKLMMEGSTYYYPGVKGVKTGTLTQSGRHLISTCSRDGYEYMVLVLGSPINDKNGEEYPLNMAFTETKKIYEWLFDGFSEKTIVEKDVELDEVPVKLSTEKNFVKVRTAERFSALLPVDVKVDDVQLITELPESVDAPIKEWDELGKVRLMLKGEELGSVPLLATESLSRNSFLYMLSWFTSISETFTFKFSVTFTIVTIFSFVALMVVRNYNRRKYRTVKRRKRM